MSVVDGIIFFCMWVLAVRSYVDNSAIRDCARELKRISDASERSAEIADRRREP